MSRQAKPKFVLLNTERAELLGWLKQRHRSYALIERARIVLLAAEGLGNMTIAHQLGVTPQTVLKWCKRFSENRLAGLEDRPRTGMPPRILPAQVDAIIARTLGTTPPKGQYWTTRTMARETGMSQSAISRIWRGVRLNPKRQSPFQVSADPHFAARMRDIVGLYLDPPIQALAICLAPPLLGPLPAKPMPDLNTGSAGSEVGLARLALTVAEHSSGRGHRLGFLRLLQALDDAVPTGFSVSLVMDNPSQDLGNRLTRWFTRHPRFRIHWAPSHAAWVSEIQHCHRVLTGLQTAAGQPRSTWLLLQAVRQHLDPKTRTTPNFLWAKATPDLVRTLKRYTDGHS